jgi:hypothetical protein
LSVLPNAAYNTLYSSRIEIIDSPVFLSICILVAAYTNEKKQAATALRRVTQVG